VPYIASMYKTKQLIPLVEKRFMVASKFFYVASQ
jgi:hypothetical protein